LTLHGLEGSIERKSAGRAKQVRQNPGGPGCYAKVRFDGRETTGIEAKKRKEKQQVAGVRWAEKKSFSM
jgi:hypothetical protein